MNSPSTKSILLVEDEFLIAFQEQMQLEEYGYSVTAVNSGESAVAAIVNSSSFDLVLMDLDLGEGIDGTEAARLILELREIPIVFLSSHTEPEVVERTQAITSYGYIVKNTGITVLDASIKMAFKLFDSYKKIQDKEARFESLFNNAPIGIVYSTLDGKIIAVNSEYARILGYSSPEDAKQAINLSSLAEAVYASPEDRRALLEQEAMSLGEWVKTEQSYRKKDGRPILAKAAFRATRENPEVLEGFLEDITERHSRAVFVRRGIGVDAPSSL